MATIVSFWALDGCCYFLMGSGWLLLFLDGLWMAIVISRALWMVVVIPWCALDGCYYFLVISWQGPDGCCYFLIGFGWLLFLMRSRWLMLSLDALSMTVAKRGKKRPSWHQPPCPRSRGGNPSHPEDETGPMAVGVHQDDRAVAKDSLLQLDEQSGNAIASGQHHLSDGQSSMDNDLLVGGKDAGGYAILQVLQAKKGGADLPLARRLDVYKLLLEGRVVRRANGLYFNGSNWSSKCLSNYCDRVRGMVGRCDSIPTPHNRPCALHMIHALGACMSCMAGCHD